MHEQPAPSSSGGFGDFSSQIKELQKLRAQMDEVNRRYEAMEKDEAELTVL